MAAMSPLEKRRLMVSIVMALGAAILGNLLSGDGLDTWFPTLKHPIFTMPAGGFLIASLLYYIGMIAALFRTLLLLDRRGAAGKAMVGLVAVLVLTESWQLLLFSMQSTLAAMIGLGPLLASVLGVGVVLLKVDKIAARIIFAYGFWLLLYITPWTIQLWQINA